MTAAISSAESPMANLSALLVATDTVEFAAKPASPAFFRRRPHPNAQRRLVADMLPVPARQVSHPIPMLVQMKADDFPLHHTTPHSF